VILERYKTWKGQKIPGLVLGTVQLGLDYGIANSQGKPSSEQIEKIIQNALDCGINFFDTAQAYGSSEEALGKAFEKLKPENDFFVISKLSPELNPKNKAEIEKAIEDSAAKFKSRAIWCMMLHRANWLENWKNGLGWALKEAKSKGLIKYIGSSVYTLEEAEASLDNPDIDIIQLSCNFWDRKMEKAGIFRKAAESDKLCFIRSIFLQGLLLMKPEEVKEKLPEAFEASRIWNKAANEIGVSLIELAASYPAKLDCPLVVGAEKPEQIIENANMYNRLSDKNYDNVYSKLEPLLSDKILNPTNWNRK
jgi:aryl-alcohol dehydrogenase-like predicted oxidoreductase